MPLDPRLLVPLSVLPAKPAGAPCAWPDWPGYEPEKRVGLLVYADVLMVASGPVTSVVTTDGLGLMPLIPTKYVYLDLTPPEPSGSRVDGLDVGLRMLGVEDGMALSLMEDGDGVSLVQSVSVDGFDYRIPQLHADGVNIGDPLALRLAVAAVLRAGAHPQTKE